MKINKIIASQVLDSRGNPTIETEVFSGKFSGKAIVPSGASTGKYEALELRDKGKAFHGMSVFKAVNNVNSIISKSLINKSFSSQNEVDNLLIKLDNTENKSNLGANSILSVSLAFSRCFAESKNKELYETLGKKFVIPIPFSNVINGGKHADDDLKIQEFMIVPIGAKSFSQAVQMVSEVYHTLKQDIETKFGRNKSNVGDEGGFAPPLKSSVDALDLISKAIDENGYSKEIKFALDCAASEFFDNTNYNIETELNLSGDKLIDYYSKLLKSYPIISIEDPFDQDDFESFKIFNRKFGRKIRIIGDDLLVSNNMRIELAIKNKLCNSLLLKVNQIGSLSEALSASSLAFKSKWDVMVSHRSGESEDSFISDLAVGLGCGLIKVGSPRGSERTCKYNRLLYIEELLGKKAKFAQI